ncbi:MAG: HAMP domain-containing histidine kinase, partial [Burkholderiales bacterium]|nr:HAMP domain-containing histidine kinase [Burkholderiales bacterium]
VDMLRTYRHRLSEVEQDELLASTEKGVARMTHLLERVLLIGQADAERLAFSPQPVNLAACVKQAVTDVLAQHPAARERLRVQLPDGDPMACLDDSLLRDVLGNLLGNAVKYSPDGGEIALTVQSAVHGWVFTVTDHGIGIPEHELPHVFESFHRGSNVGGIAGTGLGLAIVKRAVALHQGQLSVSSAGGQTCFTVVLPDGTPAQVALARA